MRLLIKQKLDSFFFITADYAFGASLEARRARRHRQGRRNDVGGVRAPLNTADFSSYLLVGAGLARQGRRARQHRRGSFHLAQAGQRIRRRAGAIYRHADHLSQRRQRAGPRRSRTTSPSCSPGTGTSTTRRAPGPSASTPAPSACPTTIRRFSIPRCAIISKRCKAAARDDALTVAKAMRDAPIHDVFTDRRPYPRGRPRRLRPLSDEGEDARRSRNIPGTISTVVAKIPADEAFRPPGAGGCTLGVQ